MAARLALYLLAIVGVVHLAMPWLRPPIRGMSDEACGEFGGGTGRQAANLLRHLIGDRPFADNRTGTCAFAGQNAEVIRSGKKVDIVFIGDSLTRHWQDVDPALFGEGRVNRGIAGHSSAHVLTRLGSDALALKPRVVHVLTGTNDVLGVHGPATPAIWQATMRAIVDSARANGVTVILGTLPPLTKNPFDSQHRPSAIIAEQNRWLRSLAQEKGLILADYHAALTGAAGGYRAGFTEDGIHPSSAGYAAIRPVFNKALAEASVASGK